MKTEDHRLYELLVAAEEVIQCYLINCYDYPHGEGVEQMEKLAEAIKKFQ